MPRKSPRQTPDTIVYKGLPPLLALGGALVTVVIWAYSNFATITYVKEQNAQIMTTIEQRHREAIEHSDMNRDRMMSVMGEIKDLVKTIETRTWQAQPVHK